MKRGEVWWADLPSPIGRRPVVLLSRNAAYPVRRFITVAPVTRRIRHISSEVLLGPEDGLLTVCVTTLDNINTILKDSLREQIATLGSDKLQAIDAAIRYALGMET